MLVPLSQRQARAFISDHHRHSRPDRGDVIRVGLELVGELIGVATAGRPKGPGLQDGYTLEVTRNCTVGHENACSCLYGAIARAAKALGYRRLYTYTLESESGASPRAAGFVQDALLAERDWSTESGRDRYSEDLFGMRRSPPGSKIRWRRDLAQAPKWVAIGETVSRTHLREPEPCSLCDDRSRATIAGLAACDTCAPIIAHACAATA